MKLYDTIFFLRLVFPPILYLGGGSTKIPPAAAPAPAPAHEGAVISARSTMNQARSRQGRASTILTASTSSSNNALRTVLGTPLQ